MRKFFLHILIAGLIVSCMAGVSPIMAEDVDIHGFISQGYLKSDKNNYLAGTDEGTFQFNEMGINFTTYATRRLKIGCQLFARDLGEVGNDNIVMNWAFAEYNFRNWLGLRAGLIKAPFAFYNDTRDYDSLRTSILLPTSVYNEFFRDGNNSVKGIEFYGAPSIGALGMLKYQLLTGETQISIESGTAQLVKLSNLDVTNLDNIQVGDVYGAHFEWLPPLDGLRLGATYAKLDYQWDALFNGTIPIRFDSTLSEWYLLSVEYMWNDLTVAAENYMYLRDAALYVIADGMPKFADIDMDSKESFYVRLSYRVTDWLETGYYYSKFIYDSDKEGDSNELYDHCLSFRFDINLNWLCKLEAHMMNGEYAVAPDDDGHTYSEWMLFGAKMTYTF